MVGYRDIHPNASLVEVVFDRRLKPISVRVYFDDGLFFAENEALLLYGTGTSPDEAITDLGLHIIHFYQYYKNLDWSQITGDALRL